MKRQRQWSRWLRLACGVPVEHVSIVLGLAPSEVASFTAGRKNAVNATDADHWRRLFTKGLSYEQIGRVVGRPKASVWYAVNRAPSGLRCPVGPPRKRRPSAILGQSCRHVRTFHELGYSAERIAEVLVLDPCLVKDFLARLEPLRRPRVSPDRLTRPRYPREERRARAAIVRAELRAGDRPDDDQLPDERRDRLRLQRSPVDAWGSRGISTEIADYARFLDAVRSGRMSGAELLGLAARAHYAEPRGCPVAEPMPWTGRVLLVREVIALTADEILEAAKMLRDGRPWAMVAKWFNVAENTLRRHIRDIAPRSRAGRRNKR